jgi:predicted alpha/beta hydrolase
MGAHEPSPLVALTGVELDGALARLAPPRWHRATAWDGWPLAVRELLPPSGRAPTHTVVLGHAMMVDGRTLLHPRRPSLAHALALGGARVLVPDLRGHGRSGPRAHEGGTWTYDDLVRDVGGYVALARALAPHQPLVLAGHSLFGHTALAWLGREAAGAARDVDGLVMIASAIWLRADEPWWPVWLWKRLQVSAMHLLATAAGRVPVRALGLGSDDEALPYWRDFLRWFRRRDWCARDGFSYRAAVADVRCPALVVVSEGDRRFARPGPTLRFSAGLARRPAGRDLIHLGVGADGPVGPGPWAALRPTHMGLVTDVGAWPLWAAVDRWTHARVRGQPLAAADR